MIGGRGNEREENRRNICGGEGELSLTWILSFSAISTMTSPSTCFSVLPTSPAFRSSNLLSSAVLDLGLASFTSTFTASGSAVANRFLARKSKYLGRRGGGGGGSRGEEEAEREEEKERRRGVDEVHCTFHCMSFAKDSYVSCRWR